MSRPQTTYHLSAHLDSYRQGYGQALSDFAVADLLLRLNRTPAALNPQEAETLAGLFVRQMADRIDEASIVAHLEALRRGSDPLSIPLSWEYPASTRIGANFPRTVSPPQFEDRETKRRGKGRHSASLFALRSCKIAWQEGVGRGEPWNVHSLKLYCSLETRLWTSEGTRMVAREKTEKIEKSIANTREKGDLNPNQDAFIRRQQSTLDRINTPFPRPSQPLYRGRPSVVVGVSLGLHEPATVAVVDACRGEALTYRSIRQLLGENYHLLGPRRRQQQRDSKKRHRAQKRSGRDRSGTSDLGEQAVGDRGLSRTFGISSESVGDVDSGRLIAWGREIPDFEVRGGGGHLDSRKILPLEI